MAVYLNSIPNAIAGPGCDILSHSGRRARLLQWRAHMDSCIRKRRRSSASLRPALFVAGAAALLLSASPASAHGFAGKRFFPATLAVEDAFVAPELDFLHGSSREPGDEAPSVHVSSLSTEFAKPVSRDFQLSVGAAYLHEKADGAGVSGFDNLGVGAKYQVFIDAKSESALAVGFDADLGGTGSGRVGAESFSTITPAVYYAKGFGRLSRPRLRAFAVTAQAGIGLPTDSAESHTLEWGLTLQYSLPYLEDFVKDTGLEGPWRNMIPLIELPMETCLDRGCGGQTTGTVNPGVVWVGKYSQVGFELALPMNSASGSGTGFLFQFHLYLDDLIPAWSRR